jgi:hypothetical protein
MCGGCGHKLRDGEPVWRYQKKTAPGMFGGWYSALAPFCAKCRLDHWEVYESRECATCGRPVHNTDRRGRRWVFCCDQCRAQHQSSRQAAVARERRAEARDVSRPCLECGEHFEPRRADSKYCSPACKQKAYRKRVTDNEYDSRVVFDSRNATAIGKAGRHSMAEAAQ